MKVAVLGIADACTVSLSGERSFAPFPRFLFDTLDTGWFSSTDASKLAALFASLSGGTIEFQLNDVDPGDQFFDFAQGLDSSVIDVGSGPVVNPGATPEPSTFLMLGTGVIGAAAQLRRRFVKA